MALSFAFSSRVLRPATCVRTFAARVTDARYQPTGGGQAAKSAKKGASTDVPNLFVAEITPAQTEAAKAKKEADAALVSAKGVLADMAAKAQVLKKVAAEAAEAQRAAEEAYRASQAAVTAASKAKEQADAEALTSLSKAKEENKRFLANAFDYFDLQKSGILKLEDIPLVLRELNYPAGHEEIAELMGAVDVNLNDTVTKKAWIDNLPIDINNALRNHPEAGKWAA